MTAGNEINLRKMYVTIRSKGGNRITETAIWIDHNIEKVLLSRGEIVNVDSVHFHDNGEEASKRWRHD